jgi:hypothetical protein
MGLVNLTYLLHRICTYINDREKVNAGELAERQAGGLVDR